MASANDVAAYVLKLQGRTSAMKLQKLVYYCQAWHLVWEGRPLFKARIEAWANGPVVPKLYREHRGLVNVSPPWPKGDPAVLDDGERTSIDVVVEAYGDFTPFELSEMTHRETPWRAARHGLAPGERGDREISHADLIEYYSGLTASARDT